MRFRWAGMMIVATGLATLTFGFAQAEQPFDDFMWSCDYRATAAEKALCEVSSAEFKKDYVAALKGSYGAQRNVAACFADGCDGALSPDLTTACAWRFVIVAAADSRMGGSDLQTLRRDCTRAGRLGEENAFVMAKALFRKIYNRALPEDIFF